MPTYVIYDKNDGRILHTHREYFMGSEEPSELDEEAVLRQFADSLPDGCEAAITAVTELRPAVGFRHFVDIQSGQIIRAEAPVQKESDQ